MKKIMGTVALYLCSVAPSYAAIIDISYLDIDFAHVDAAFLPPGGIDLNVTTSDNLVGGYIAEITSTSIGGGLQTLYSAPMNQNPNGVGPAAGTFLGGPAPSGIFNTSNNTLQVNLSSMFADHGAMDQNIGAIAFGSYDSISDTYEMSWSTVLTQGPNAGQVTTFTFAGSTSIVPVPAAAWLFGSGLLGLAFVSRRKVS